MSRLPPEWESHERTLIAWPSRDERWDDVDEAAVEIAAIANAIVQFEPVTVIADPTAVAEARSLLSGDIELHESAIDDAWLRDSGPVVVPDRAIGFGFNGWGGRWTVAHDATLPERVAQIADLRLERSALVLEGGAFAITADHTLIAAESCLLNPNRNPDWTREQVEEELVARLGVARVVWLTRGLDSDDDTDGHVDRFLKAVPSGDVLLQHVDDDHVDFEALTEAAHQLQHAGIDVLLFDVVEFVDDDRPFPYLAGYACNDAVLVPQSGDPVLDERAVEVYRLAFPEREPIGIGAVTLALGGGGISTVCLPVPGDPEWSEPLLRLERWSDPIAPDDPDARFKAQVAALSQLDPTETLEGIARALGIPPGAIARYVLARWASEGSAGLLEIGPSMVQRLWAPIAQAEAAGDDAARLAAYAQVRGMLSWLRAPLDADQA